MSIINLGKGHQTAGWIKCEICSNEFRWEDETCRETDTGDLCPKCTAEWNAEMEAEIESQN